MCGNKMNPEKIVQGNGKKKLIMDGSPRNTL